MQLEAGQGRELAVAEYLFIFRSWSGVRQYLIHPHVEPLPFSNSRSLF